MRPLVTIFLAAFLLDALLSVANAWLPALAPLRQFVAWFTLAAAVPIYLAMAFNRRLPKRLLLPPTLFLFWAGLCGGFPLPFVWPLHARPALEWTQLLLALPLLAAHLRAAPAASGPAFSWKNLAFFTLVTILGTPFLLAAAAINGLGTSMERATDGYVKLRPAGILLEERELARDGKRVRLVSMMHIGAKDFYEDVQDSLPADGKAIVLLEGISDEQELLRSGFSYGKIAGLLGLSSQESSRFQRNARAREGGEDSSSPEPGKLDYRRADLDVSAFLPSTIGYMNAIGGLLEDPTAETFLRTVQDPASPLNVPGIEQTVMNDILDKRNLHLLAAITTALQTHETLIVPWGALHLPFIEAALEQQGFRETRRDDRAVIPF